MNELAYSGLALVHTGSCQQIENRKKWNFEFKNTDNDLSNGSFSFQWQVHWSLPEGQWYKTSLNELAYCGLELVHYRSCQQIEKSKNLILKMQKLSIQR